MKKILFILTLVLSTLILTSCKKDNYKKIFEDSLNESSNVTYEIEIYDNDILFYESTVSYDFGDKCYENVNTKTYSQTFKEVTTSNSYEHEAYAKKDYVSFDLSDSVLNDVKENNGIYSFTVTKENASKFFGNDLGINSDVNVEMTISNGKINTLVSSYVDSTKETIISVTFNY